MDLRPAPVRPCSGTTAPGGATGAPYDSPLPPVNPLFLHFPPQRAPTEEVRERWAFRDPASGQNPRYRPVAARQRSARMSPTDREDVTQGDHSAGRINPCDTTNRGA